LPMARWRQPGLMCVKLSQWWRAGNYRFSVLASWSVRRYCLTDMKSVSVREFYHHVGMVDGLTAGKQLLVTANGKPKFVVTKTDRPKMTRALAEARAVGKAGR